MQYCASFWNHRDEWYDPKLYRHTDCCFCICFTNATQITRAVQRPEAPALLPVFLMTLIFCNAQRLMGMQRFVNGYLPYWFVLWVPVCVANRCCWADLKLSSSLFQCLLKPVFTAPWSALLGATESAQVNLNHWMVSWPRSVTEWTLWFGGFGFMLHSFPALQKNSFVLPL